MIDKDLMNRITKEVTFKVDCGELQFEYETVPEVLCIWEREDTAHKLIAQLRLEKTDAVNLVGFLNEILKELK